MITLLATRTSNHKKHTLRPAGQRTVPCPSRTFYPNTPNTLLEHYFRDVQYATHTPEDAFPLLMVCSCHIQVRHSSPVYSQILREPQARSHQRPASPRARATHHEEDHELRPAVSYALDRQKTLGDAQYISVAHSEMDVTSGTPPSAEPARSTSTPQNMGCRGYRLDGREGHLNIAIQWHRPAIE